MVVGLITTGLVLLYFSTSIEAYKNYTVGDSLGWYDNLHTPNIDYQKWAHPYTFTLGDFLVFNTDNNHSVVQTYNFTTYKSCDYDDSSATDTTEWSAADPSATDTHPVTVAIPLVKEGPTFFFSGNYDGEQCENGQHFQVNVTHGKGLPETLKSPADQAPAPNSRDVNNADSAPDTDIDSDFGHPQKGNDDTPSIKKDSGSTTLYENFYKIGLVHLILMLLRLFATF